MTSFKVYGSAKVTETVLNKFDYSVNPEVALATFATLVSTRKTEVYKAFNELCHIAMAHACAYKTTKERHEKIQETRDAFFAALPKQFARAFAKGVTALEWGIPEGFEDFDFSGFLEAEKKEPTPRERGAMAVLNQLRKKLEALQNKKSRTSQEEEERLVYAFLVKASKEFTLS